MHHFIVVLMNVGLQVFVLQFYVNTWNIQYFNLKLLKLYTKHMN